MKATEGNVRRGPSLSHRIDWIFKQYPESPKKIKIGRKIDMWVVRDSLAIK